MWIDTHCHLAGFVRDGSLAACLEDAKAQGVGQCVTVGTSQEDWGLYRDLAATYPGRVYYTVGLHPSEVAEDWEEQVVQLAPWFTDRVLPVGLGEIGLDYFRLPKFPDEAAQVRVRQQEAFAWQLGLALELDCPVVVHCRDAFGDSIRLIDASGVDWQRVVFHCFSFGEEEIRILNARGARASFTGIVTYANALDVRQALLAQGQEVLMLETDAPYLAPTPHRGKPNVPAFLRHTGQYCAGLLGLPEERLAARTSENARGFFRLDQADAGRRA